MVKKLETFEVESFRGLDLRPLPTTGDPRSLIASNNVSLSTAREIVVRDQLEKVCDLDPLSRGLYVVNNELRACLPWRANVPSASGPVLYDAIDDKLRWWSNLAGARTKRLVAVTTAIAYDQRPYLVVAYETVLAGAVIDSGWEHHWIAPSPLFLTRTGTATSGSNRVVIPVPVGWVAPSPLVTPIAVQFGGYAGPGLLLPTLNWTAATVNVRDPLDNPNAVVVYLNAPFNGPTGSYQLRLSQTIDTNVKVPFTPGPAAVAAAGKVFASRRGTPDVPFSSTLNGPTDWLEEEDAGFLPTSKNVDGQQEIQGLGIFDGQLVVFFETAAQVWQIGPDPGTHALIGSVGGAGCLYPRSVANVMGDLLYFSNGAFRLASAVLTTGQKKEGDIGAPIAPLTRQVARTATPVSVWSPYRQQYICFIGTTAYALTNSPESQVQAWTTWTLPFEVEAVVELDQVLYVRRSGTNEVWKFSPAAVETGFSWSAQFAFTDLALPGQLKALQQLMMSANMAMQVDLQFNPGGPFVPVGTVEEATANMIILPDFTELLSLRLSGSQPGTVGHYVVRFRPAGQV